MFQSSARAALVLLLGVACCASWAAATGTHKPAARTYKATLLGKYQVPRTNSKAKGSVQVIVVNETYAHGYCEVKNIRKALFAHIHRGNATSNGPVLVTAFNPVLGGDIQPISGSFKFEFFFNPNATNFEALTKDYLTYFNVHTEAYPSGEIRGNFRKVTTKD